MNFIKKSLYFITMSLWHSLIWQPLKLLVIVPTGIAVGSFVDGCTRVKSNNNHKLITGVDEREKLNKVQKTSITFGLIVKRFAIGVFLAGFNFVESALYNLFSLPKAILDKNTKLFQSARGKKGAKDFSYNIDFRLKDGSLSQQNVENDNHNRDAEELQVPLQTDFSPNNISAISSENNQNQTQTKHKDIKNAHTLKV